MKIGKWIAIGLLVLPVAELAAFILVAAGIGWGPALALLVGTSLAGLVMLRRQHRGRLERLRDTVSRGGAADVLTGPDALAMIGEILLILPGFITDVAGLLLLLPKVRQRLGATIRRAPPQGPRRREGRDAPDSVVDLAPGEWHHLPDPDAPRRRHEISEP